jgi:hypothetical protein
METANVDGLLVDLETGEILEFPEGITGDKFEWAKHKLLQAQEQEKVWKARVQIFKSSLGKMLIDMGVKKHEGVQWVTGATVPKVKSDSFVDFIEQMEVPDSLKVTYYRDCSSTYNAKKVMEFFGGAPGDDGYNLIHWDQRAGYVRYDPPAHMAEPVKYDTRLED